MSYGWAPYVPVAERRAKAAKKVAKLRKQGNDIQPLTLEGKKIASSFWGKAWCSHLEKFSDFSNRLPRGRTYVRNGSVCHLKIEKGEIEALVSGSSLYKIKITIDQLPQKKWRTIKKQCTGQISSILDLLRGSLSNGVMAVVTNSHEGLFPRPKEIHLSCNCPDWAGLCKHLAAVLYGVGARLDQSPQLLFLLRGVDHEQLVDAELTLPTKTTTRRQLKGNLADVFSIDIDEGSPTEKPTIKPKPPARKTSTIVTKPKVKAKTKAKLKEPIKKSKNKMAAIEITPKRPFSITAKGLARLRKKLSVNRSQFSSLLNVSPTTIKNWEEKTGKLALKPEHLATLAKLSTLDKAAASRLLKKLLTAPLK